MKIKDEYILRKIAGEYVVIPSGADLDLNVIITLNETGGFLWKQLESGAEKEDLVKALTKEYEVSEDHARSSVDAFIEKLYEHEFLA